MGVDHPATPHQPFVSQSSARMAPATPSLRRHEVAAPGGNGYDDGPVIMMKAPEEEEAGCGHTEIHSRTFLACCDTEGRGLNLETQKQGAQDEQASHGTHSEPSSDGEEDDVQSPGLHRVASRAIAAAARVSGQPIHQKTQSAITRAPPAMRRGGER